MSRNVPVFVCLMLAALSAGQMKAHAQPPACIPAGLAQLSEEDRAIALETIAPRNIGKFALDLIPCLEDPDPEVRDGFAYESLSKLMRAGRLKPDMLQAMKASLLSNLAAADEDPKGFRGPFAALVLAEVARTDRISPWMTEAERSELIASAHAYLGGLTDYRGFDETEGWRHGVAHTADLLMQLSLNPALTRPQAEAILAAVALQVAPSTHAYVFGESGRLAAPVVYLSRRDMFSEEEWTGWLLGLWPADDPLRQNVYGSVAALMKRHNLNAFANEIYVASAASAGETPGSLEGPALALMSELP
ncbi:DUF2785 domain-containing protein [Hyphomonas sp.]|uniref:DUF2785 domain-containing protein n=1 Tax=Hyphomonas sp. TaxID=87 RepID=UPI003529C0AA